MKNDHVFEPTSEPESTPALPVLSPPFVSASPGTTPTVELGLLKR